MELYHGPAVHHGVVIALKLSSETRRHWNWGKQKIVLTTVNDDMIRTLDQRFKLSTISVSHRSWGRRDVHLWIEGNNHSFSKINFVRLLIFETHCQLLKYWHFALVDSPIYLQCQYLTTSENPKVSAFDGLGMRLRNCIFLTNWTLKISI